MGFVDEGTEAFPRDLEFSHERAVRGLGIGAPAHGVGADGAFWDVFIDYLFSHVPIKDSHGNGNVPSRC